MKVTTDGESARIETSIYDTFPHSDEVVVEVRPSSMSEGYAVYVDIMVAGKKTTLLIESGRLHLPNEPNEPQATDADVRRMLNSERRATSFGQRLKR